VTQADTNTYFPVAAVRHWVWTRARVQAAMCPNRVSVGPAPGRFGTGIGADTATGAAVPL